MEKKFFLSSNPFHYIPFDEIEIFLSRRQEISFIETLGEEETF